MATVAALFAVAGIMAVVAGAPIPALIMGCVIELGKIVGVSWIYRNWQEKTKIKYFMLPAVIVAIFLTSMGIFGFLSKAHLEQNADVGNNTLQIERLDQRISRQQAVINREQDRIDNADAVIANLDETIATLIEFDKISDPVNGARAVRERQKPERDALAAEVTEAQSNMDAAEDTIADLQDDRLVLSQEVRELELEIGPVKYIAELIYEDPETSFEDAVRLVIIAFIFVFDPMAILLLMGANFQLMKVKRDSDDEPTPPEDNGEDLIDLIDDEDIAVDTVNDRGSDQYANPRARKPDRSWLTSIPKDDAKVDTQTVISTIQKLRSRKSRTKDEQILLERFQRLAKSRGVPWDQAKREINTRALVDTSNTLLKD